MLGDYNINPSSVDVLTMPLSTFQDMIWENINTETFLKLYCQEDDNNETDDEISEYEQKEVFQATAENWQKKAAEIHQNMANQLGDRLFDSIPSKDKTYFLRKLGFALYGLPEKFTDIGYSEDKLKTIKAIGEMIVELQGSRKDLIICHTVFVIIFIEGEPLIPVPVFRVPKPGCDVNENCPMIFVDREHRRYDNWQCFLKENNLPKCWISYPVDGIYQTSADGNVMVECCKSPACGIIQETLDILDTTSTVAMVGSTVVGLASLVVPVAAPFVIAAGMASGSTGVYGIGRSIVGLIDRGRHGQSVAPTDLEARGHWISTVGSALSVASFGAVKAVSNAARTGQVTSKAVLIATDCLQVGSLVMNGLGIVNHGYHLYLKKHYGGEITSLDCFQFASSVLFFSNSVINLTTAKTIFKQEQRSHIKQHRNALRSNRHRRQFDRLSRNTRKEMRNIEGRAKVIRAINNIENHNDFYAGVARASKQYKVYKAKMTFTENGQICLNGKAVLHPMELASLQKSERATIFAITRNLYKGRITNSQYAEQMQAIFLRNNMKFTEDSISSVKNICTAFRCKDLFKSIFKEGSESYLSKPEVLKSFFNLIMNANYKTVFHTAAQITNRLGFKTTESTIQFLEFACPYFANLYNEFHAAYNTYCSLKQNEISLPTAFHCIMLNVYNSFTAMKNLKQEYEIFRNSGSKDPEDHIRGSILIDACPENINMNVPKFITFANLFYSVFIELQSAICNIKEIKHFADSDNNIEFVKSLGNLLGNVLETYRTGKMFAEMYQQNTGANEAQCSPIVKCALFCRLAAVIAVKLGYVNLEKFCEFVNFMLHQLFREYGQATEDLEKIEVIISSHYEYPQQLKELQRHFNRSIQKDQRQFKLKETPT